MFNCLKSETTLNQTLLSLNVTFSYARKIPDQYINKEIYQINV